MAHKRTAHQAFGGQNGTLSAFAAAKLARSSPSVEPAGDVQAWSGSEDDLVELPDHVERVNLQDESRYSARLTAPSRYSSLSHPATSVDQKTTKYRLNLGESLLAIGEYEIEVLEGVVTVYGAALRKGGRHLIYAPSTHALPRIRAKTNATVHLHSVKSQIRKLETVSPFFRNIWSAGELSYTPLIAQESDHSQRNLPSLDESSETQKLISHLCAQVEQNKHLSIMCVGPKASGKSTFMRTMCNAMLTMTPAKRCLYIDIDPGQPEFGPPGQLYLVEITQPVFGPPFTHFASHTSSQFRLISAHTLAATSFRDNPAHYLACVRALFDHQLVQNARRNADCPVLINSCGWTHGLGASVLSEICALGITDAILLDVADPVVNASIARNCETAHVLSRASTRPSIRTSAALRQMHTMAYFHSRVCPPETNESAAIVAKPIAEWRPWKVGYDGEKPGIAGVVSYGQIFNPEFLAEILEGTLVALVTVGSLDAVGLSATANGASGNLDYPTTVGGLAHFHREVGLAPDLCKYHGLALIRSLDVDARTIHLISSLNDTAMSLMIQSTILLVRGAFDTPEWAYLEDASSGKAQDGDCAPWVTSKEMVGIEGAVWRLRHPPTAGQAAASR